MKKGLSEVQNALLSIIIVAILLFSIAQGIHLLTVVSLYSMAYLKWYVVEYSKDYYKLDKLMFYLYFSCGLMYTVLLVLLTFSGSPT
jgi:hypothetical protein